MIDAKKSRLSFSSRPMLGATPHRQPRTDRNPTNMA